MSRDVPIVSVIPANISTEAVLEKLRDHEFMIRLSPLITDVVSIKAEDCPHSKDAPAYSEWYKLKENIPIRGQIEFYAAFKDQPDGFDSVVYAPAGLTMDLKTRVVQGDAADPETRVLREDNHLDGYWILMGFITWQFSKAHREMHRRLFERIREGK